MDPTPHPTTRQGFALTRWTLVQRARGESPEARAALSDLCALYYAPVEAFIRCQGLDPEEARDLTQEFFARLLGGSGVTGADAGRGRFRSYLLGAVKHFLQVERVRRMAAKRGGGAEHLRLTAHPEATSTGANPRIPGWSRRIARSTTVGSGSADARVGSARRGDGGRGEARAVRDAQTLPAG